MLGLSRYLRGRRGGAPGDGRPAGPRAAVKPARLSRAPRRLLAPFWALRRSWPRMIRPPSSQQIQLSCRGRARHQGRPDRGERGRSASGGRSSQHLRGALAVYGNAARPGSTRRIARVHRTERAVSHHSSPASERSKPTSPGPKSNSATPKSVSRTQAVAMYMEASAMPGYRTLLSQTNVADGGHSDRVRR